MNQNLSAATKAAHEAIDKAAAAMSGNGDLDAACDGYTAAAKNFAALLLAERIKRSFDGKIDEKTGKTVESLDDKIAHARKIGDWVSPWNFGFLKPETTEVYRIHAMSTGTHGPENGTYTATQYGGGRHKISAWPEIKGIIDHGHLVDATNFIARKEVKFR